MLKIGYSYSGNQESIALILWVGSSDSVARFLDYITLTWFVVPSLRFIFPQSGGEKSDSEIYNKAHYKDKPSMPQHGMQMAYV